MLYTIYGQQKSKDETIVFLRDFYNNIDNDLHAREKEVLKCIDKPIDRNNKLLDFGCGWGYISQKAAEQGWDVTGIDISKNEIAISQLAQEIFSTAHNKVNFTNKDITSFEEGEFDTVVSIQVIEHVHNPGTYLSKINRVLRPGGRLIISIPNVITFNSFTGHLYRSFENGLRKISDTILEKYDKTNHHIQAWDAMHFTRLVSSVGFKFDSYTPIQGVPCPDFVSLLRKSFFQRYLRKHKRLSHFSYAMIFTFIKVKNIEILEYE